MLGALWFLQRRLARGAQRRQSTETVRVLGRQSLSPKAKVVVVEIEGSRYVLGVTERGISVVDRLPRPGVAPLAALDPRDGAGDEGFDRILTLVRDPDDAPVVPRLRERRRQDPLRGSILSSATWRQTAEALRRTR